MILEFALPSVAWTTLLLTSAGILVLAVLTFIQPRGHRKPYFIPFLFRLLVLCMLGLILASPFTERATFSGTLPVLIDVSESMDSQQGEKLFQAARAMQRPELPIALYPFARKASSVPFSPSDFSSYEQMRSAFVALDPSASALSEAVEALVGGRGGVPLMLASDAFETRGSIKERLPLLKQKQVRIYPLLPAGSQANQGFFRISQIHAPLTAAQLTSSQVRVTVENSTGEARSADLEILEGTNVLLKQSVRVNAGSEEVYVAQTLPAKGGIEKISARLIPKEKQYGESARETFIAAEGREKILLLSGSSQDGAYLSRVLENQAYQLENRVGTMPSDSLLNYSTIILNNISIEQLGRGNADAVVQAARAGKGIIMVGGDRSFGLGGYRGTVIEDALPVELLPPQREEKRLNVAVMLVIDKSRSMDADSKMDYAKEAARTFISNMKNEDYIGVIAFDASPFIVVRLGLLAEIRSMAADRIARIFPTGSTRPLSAIDEARRSLVRVNAGRKHMLFLTDGQIEDAGPQYKELIKQMRLLGITSSTVMLGSDADGRFLKELAEQGGGAYYQTNDARSLPRIFLSDVRVASGGEQTMHEQRQYSVALSSDGHLRSTDIAKYPDLFGYVDTRIKPKANLELVASDGATAAPLLARWQYGQGNVVAFTSDASGRWSRNWIEWDKYHQFWNDLLNSVRPENETGLEKIPFDMRHFVEDSKLVIEYALYSEDLSGNFSAQLKAPDGTMRDVAFRQVSPGRFRAEIADPMPGRYDIAGSLEKRKTAPVAFSLPPDGFREQKGLGFNIPLLDLITRATGTIMNPQPESLIRGLNKNMTRDDRSEIFVFFAIIFALLEIVFREILSRRAFRIAPGITALILALLCAAPVDASPRSDFYINQAFERYFQLPADARTISTGGSDGLNCRGSVCSFLNPAGLGFTKGSELGLTLSDRNISGEEFLTEEQIRQSEDRGYIAAAIPVGEMRNDAPAYGAFGFAYSRYHGDTDDQIGSSPDGHRRTVSYGLSPFERIAFGYSLSFYDDQLKSDLADLHSHARFLHLFGVQANLGKGFSLAGLFQLGVGQSDTEDFKFRSNGLSHLKQYSSSVSLKKNWSSMSFAVGGDYTDLHSEGNLDQVSQPVVIGGDEEGYLYNVRTGFEAELFERLFGRIGYRFFAGHYGFRRPDLMDLGGAMHGSGFSGGLGYVFNFCEQALRLDYGVEYVTIANKDLQHILTLAWQF